MKRIWIAIGILAGATLMSGCATHRQMSEANLELIELRREHQEMKTSLARMDSLVAEQNVLSRKLNADFFTGMQQLQDRMSLVESRLADAGTQFNIAASMIETKKPSAPADSSDTNKTVDPLNPESMYRTAYYEVIKGNYDMAIKGMEEYLKRYPQTSLADNALYWIGECHYTQKDYPKAQEAFERLLKDYPQSENLAATKLKLGLSLFNQKNKTKAKQYFQDVVKNYPGTDEANQAAETLKRYDNR
jgi:tol-pal system protein YbgF